MKELVFAGFGGQGVLTAGLIISQIALYKGYNATWMPAYGAAMRGGTANCTVKYGEGMIYNPGQQEPDLLLAMNTPSLKKFAEIVKPGGTILVNADMVEASELSIREDVNIAPIITILAPLGLFALSARILQCTGTISKLMGDFDHETGVAGMNDMFRKKGKNKFEAQNAAAFEAGYYAV